MGRISIYGMAVAGLLAAVLFSGCRTGRYFLVEPIESQVLFANGDEWWYVDLEANPTTGYQWRAFTNSDQVTFAYDSYTPGRAESGVFGNPGVQRITIHTSPGFSEPATVTLKYMRVWSGEVAREVRFEFMHNSSAFTPWN